jgi:uncharacterized membrane protein
MDKKSIIIMITAILFLVAFTNVITYKLAENGTNVTSNVTPEQVINIEDSGNFTVNGDYQEIKPVTIITQPVQTRVVKKTEVVYKQPVQEPEPTHTIIPKPTPKDS